jgi:hypothetical protein
MPEHEPCIGATDDWYLGWPMKARHGPHCGLNRDLHGKQTGVRTLADSRRHRHRHR